MPRPRRSLLALSAIALSTLACTPPAKRSDASDQAANTDSAKAKPVPTRDAADTKTKVDAPTKTKTDRRIVRTELVAEDLPPLPTLTARSFAVAAEGVLAMPEGADELAAREVVALEGGLLFAGQAYKDRVPGRVPQSWRWTGWVPSEGEAQSTRHGPGAVRAAVADGRGAALLAGSHGIDTDARPWFGVVEADGTLSVDAELEAPNFSDAFTVIAGTGDEERAVIAGFLDQQGWAASLDARGQIRWQKYVRELTGPNPTQIRALARLPAGPLLAAGARGKQFGKAWAAHLPADGGAQPTPEDVEDVAIAIDGVDDFQMLQAIVDLGEAGIVALGIGKRGYIQTHDQLIAVGFDPAGKLRWAKVLPDARVSEIRGGARVGEGAVFHVRVPTSAERGAAQTLAVVHLDAAGVARVEGLADSEGWSSAGIVARGSAELVTVRSSATQLSWRRLTLAP